MAKPKLPPDEIRTKIAVHYHKAERSELVRFVRLTNRLTGNGNRGQYVREVSIGVGRWIRDGSLHGARPWFRAQVAELLWRAWREANPAPDPLSKANFMNFLTALGVE